MRLVMGPSKPQRPILEPALRQIEASRKVVSRFKVGTRLRRRARSSVQVRARRRSAGPQAREPELRRSAAPFGDAALARPEGKDRGRPGVLINGASGAVRTRRTAQTRRPGDWGVQHSPTSKVARGRRWSTTQGSRAGGRPTSSWTTSVTRRSPGPRFAEPRGTPARGRHALRDVGGALGVTGVAKHVIDYARRAGRTCVFSATSPVGRFSRRSALSVQQMVEAHRYVAPAATGNVV